MLNMRTKLALSVILALGFIGCGGGGGDTPKDVALEDVKKLYKGDIDFIIKPLEVEMEKVIKEAQKESSENNRSFKNVEVVSESTEGDKARIELRLHYSDDTSRTMNIPLKKIKDKWVLEFEKFMNWRYRY